GVDLRRVDDRDAAGAAPFGERPYMTECRWGAEARDRELGDRLCRFGGPLEPGPARMKACEMDGPSVWIQPPDHLDHLAFGTAGLEAGHPHRDRHAAGLQHLDSVVSGLPRSLRFGEAWR